MTRCNYAVHITSRNDFKNILKYYVELSVRSQGVLCCQFLKIQVGAPFNIFFESLCENDDKKPGCVGLSVLI